MSRGPLNIVITATANKLARIAWAVLSTGKEYRAHHGQENPLSTNRPNNFAQTSPSVSFPLQSRGGPYIPGN